MRSMLVRNRGRISATGRISLKLLSEGLVAINAGKNIKYNAKKMRATNDWDANKYLESHYYYEEEFLSG